MPNAAEPLFPSTFEPLAGPLEGLLVEGVTRARFGRDVARIAAAIGAPGGEVDGQGSEEILVLCHDRYHFACAMVAAWVKGLVVALPPSSQPEIVRQLRLREGVRGVLHDAPDMPGIDVRPLLEEGADDLAIPQPALQIPSDRRIVIVYTSGSTGSPMPCPKTAAQLLGEAWVHARVFELAASDVVVSSVPPHHIYGLLFGVLLPLLSGARLVRETPLHPEPLLALWQREGGTILVAVPVHLRSLSALPAGSVTPLPRHLFSSGAALPRETAEMLSSHLGLQATEVLGSSETGGIGTRVARPEGLMPTPFRPLPGVRVSTGQDGRLRVDSPFLDPSIARPWETGDRIELREDGCFFHLGRVDGVVKVGGTRVSLQALEERILAIPGVRECSIWAVEVGGARGQETWAVIAGDASLTTVRVRSELLRFFDAVVVPRRMRFVDALPREATGKIRRETLEALFQPSPREGPANE